MNLWNTSRLEELSSADLQFVLGVVALAGVLYCFLGYRIFKTVLAMTGFLLAGPVAAALLGWLTQGHLLAMGIAFLVGGCCGAMALFFLYRAGVFCLGFLGALLGGYAFLHGRPEAWAPWAMVGVAFLGGLVALWAERPVMTLATAAIGAWLTAGAAALLVFGAEADPRLVEFGASGAAAWVFLGVWLFLTLAGAGAQFRGGKRRPKSD